MRPNQSAAQLRCDQFKQRVAIAATLNDCSGVGVKYKYRERESWRREGDGNKGSIAAHYSQVTFNAAASKLAYIHAASKIRKKKKAKK